MSVNLQRNVASLVVSLAVVGGICVWIARNIDVQATFEVLGSAKPWPIVLMTALTVATYVLRAMRLHVVLQRAGNFRHTFYASSIGQMVNCLLPLRSGEICMTLLLGPTLQGGRSEALSRLFVDRLLDAMAALSLFAVAMLIVGQSAALGAGFSKVLLLSAALAAALIIAIFTLCAFGGFARSRAGSLAAYFGADRERWERRAGAALDGLRPLFHGRVLVVSCALSLLTWLTLALAIHEGTAALFAQPPFASALIALGLTVLGLVTVPMPAGVGTTHAAITLALTMFGVRPEQALGFAIIYHLVTTTTSILFGLLGLLALNLKLGTLLQSIRTSASAS